MCPPKSTWTARSGCGNSHGPPNASQESGNLDLAPVDEGLAEDAVLVADPEADARHVHGRQRVHEAGRQPTQTAVAQPRLDLLRQQRRQVDPTARQTLLDNLAQTGGQQGIAKLTAKQILRGQVTDHLRPRLTTPARGLQPVRHQVVPHRARQR